MASSGAAPQEGRGWREVGRSVSAEFGGQRAGPLGTGADCAPSFAREGGGESLFSLLSRCYLQAVGDLAEGVGSDQNFIK